jgi:hypothetical protein
MDPSLEDPSSPTDNTPPSPPPASARREENQDEQDDLDKGRPKNTDQEDHGVQTAGIKRRSSRR